MVTLKNATEFEDSILLFENMNLPGDTQVFVVSLTPLSDEPPSGVHEQKDQSICVFPNTTQLSKLYPLLGFIYLIPSIILYVLVIRVLFTSRSSNTSVTMIFKMQCAVDLMLCISAAIQFHIFPLKSLCDFFVTANLNSVYTFLIVPLLGDYSITMHYVCTCILSINRMTYIAWPTAAFKWWPLYTNRVLWVCSLCALIPCFVFSHSGGIFCLFGDDYIIYQALPGVYINQLGLTADDFANLMALITFVVLAATSLAMVCLLVNYPRDTMKSVEKKIYRTCAVLITINLLFISYILTLYILLLPMIYVKITTAPSDFFIYIQAVFTFYTHTQVNRLAYLITVSCYVIGFLGCTTVWIVIISDVTMRCSVLNQLGFSAEKKSSAGQRKSLPMGTS